MRVAKAFEHFVDISTVSVARSVDSIRADGIAILFDLNGYTRNARSELFALRSAPLQVNSIGFPGLWARTGTTIFTWTPS
jgi:protein O-GlcNAc transferase